MFNMRSSTTNPYVEDHKYVDVDESDEVKKERGRKERREREVLVYW